MLLSTIKMAEVILSISVFKNAVDSFKLFNSIFIILVLYIQNLKYYFMAVFHAGLFQLSVVVFSCRNAGPVEKFEYGHGVFSGKSGFILEIDNGE